jgi:hypothetical protein
MERTQEAGDGEIGKGNSSRPGRRHVYTPPVAARAGLPLSRAAAGRRGWDDMFAVQQQLETDSIWPARSRPWWHSYGGWRSEGTRIGRMKLVFPESRGWADAPRLWDGSMHTARVRWLAQPSRRWPCRAGNIEEASSRPRPIPAPGCMYVHIPYLCTYMQTCSPASPCGGDAPAGKSLHPQVTEQ